MNKDEAVKMNCCHNNWKLIAAHLSNFLLKSSTPCWVSEFNENSEIFDNEKTQKCHNGGACQYVQIFMMLSEGSGNQKSMWTKLPAAFKWITAVHHHTLGDTFHQLNKKHDKALLRNNLLFNSVQFFRSTA